MEIKQIKRKNFQLWSLYYTKRRETMNKQLNKHGLNGGSFYKNNKPECYSLDLKCPLKVPCLKA
jgi:hypothetical protein